MPPDARHADDPRLPELLEKALAKNGLHPQLHTDMVRKLVLGQADPRQYVCCNSGCVPCSKDYLRAAEQVLGKLGKPAKRKRRWGIF